MIYKVNTQQIAVSAQDAIFGNVKVLWRDTPVNNLYFTTVTIENISTTDFKDPQFNNEVQHLGPAEPGGYPKFHETILQASIVSRT